MLFTPGDSRSSIEVDIWAKDLAGEQYRIELGRCWHISGGGWVHKADEQLRTWQADLDKLSKVSTDDVQIFVLFGCLAADPQTDLLATRTGVLKRMTDSAHHSVVPFTWRQLPISWLSVSMWEWKRGEAI